jgi:probable HAF family extracellular repeat protein
MKSSAITYASAASFLVACFLPVLVTAQPKPANHRNSIDPVSYTVTDLGLSGVAPPAQPFTIADVGLIAGSVVANGNAHATLWYEQFRLDISKRGLGGQNSIAFGVNNWGHATGEAQTSSPDPNQEDFCGFKSLGLSSSGTCLPFLWKYGNMHPLTLLGGHNGAANQINDWGETVGTAENATADPACPSPQLFQFKPVLWEGGGMVHALATSGIDVKGVPFDDPDGVAFAINQHHQAVGASGLCAPFSPFTFTNLQPLHAVLWEEGKTIDLGNLGGDGHAFGNVALNINNRGQIVGNSDLPGDATNHAFLWTKEIGMQDLGTLQGDFISAGLGINDEGVVVGVSLDQNFNQRAVIWRSGAIVDLNTLIPSSTSFILQLACSINSRGEIIGLALDTMTGKTHGYLATPVQLKAE